MKPEHTIGDSAELAALYGAGAMSPAELTAFEQHLATGCEVCAAEVAALTHSAAALAADVPAAIPPAALREKILSKVAGPAEPHRQVWRDWQPGPENTDLVVTRAEGGVWEETGVKGVRVKRLSIDRQKDQFTALVRMEAGSSYPRHVHNGAEECLVLEGELRVGDDTLRAGDFQRAPAGSRHGVQSTDSGCLLLIVSSLSDEMY